MEFLRGPSLGRPCSSSSSTTCRIQCSAPSKSLRTIQKSLIAFHRAAGSDLVQRDLDAMTEWSNLWQLPFNETKCKVIHVGTRNLCHSYTMGDLKLEQVTIEKDLGIHLDSVLKFRKQAASADAKGNQMLALVRRSVCYIEPCLSWLLKTLLRPHLEYGNVNLIAA